MVNPKKSPCEDDGNRKKEEQGPPVMVKSPIDDSGRKDRKDGGNDEVSQKSRCAVINFRPFPLVSS